MDHIDYFRAIQQSMGASSEADAKKRYERDRLARELKSSVNYTDDVIIRDVKYPLIIVPDSTDMNECKIESVDNSCMTFEIGDIVETGGRHWLVTEKEGAEFAQSFGKMRLCNQEFRWQSPDGVVHSVWGIFSTAYRVGRLDRNFNDAHGQFEGLVPYNEETRRIPLNQRFILWSGFDTEGKEIPIVYKANRIDHNSSDYGSGTIIVIELARDVYNGRDDIKTMVADYRNVEQAIEPEGIRAEIIGGSTLRIGGNPRTLMPGFTARGGEVDPSRAVWTLDETSDIYGYFNIENVAGGGVRLSLIEDTPRLAIGSTIKISLSDVYGVFAPVEKILEVI